MNLKVNTSGVPLLDQLSEEGFVNCVFKIENMEETDKSYKFHMSALYDGEFVGMNAEVVRGIDGGLNEDMTLISEHVYRKGIVFRRSGKESDLLLNVLAQLYGLNLKIRKMVEEETFTAIALHQCPIDMVKEDVRIKIFGNDAGDIDEAKYNESFFNVNLQEGYIFWDEKDMDYREPLIRSLTKSFEKKLFGIRF